MLPIRMFAFTRLTLSVCTLAAVAGALILGGAAQPAGAATVSVNIQNFGFNPHVVTSSLGGKVTWTQDDVGTHHTVTSDQGFFGSRLLARGQTYTATFPNAGAYGYHCTVHPDMTATVRVPLTAGGSATAGWTLRWSTLSSTPANRVFDVQIKRPGSNTWAAFHAGTKARAAFFNPARTGVYAFRARTDVVHGPRSGWSPAHSVSIS
jgi:plastocyanin